MVKARGVDGRKQERRMCLRAWLQICVIVSLRSCLPEGDQTTAAATTTVLQKKDAPHGEGGGVAKGEEAKKLTRGMGSRPWNLLVSNPINPNPCNSLITKVSRMLRH